MSSIAEKHGAPLGGGELPARVGKKGTANSAPKRQLRLGDHLTVQRLEIQVAGGDRFKGCDIKGLNDARGAPLKFLSGDHLPVFDGG